MNRAATGLIRTPDQRLRVFVSSTLRELAQERRAVRAAIERLALAPVMFELGARPHPPRSLYRAYLDQSDVFVGIYGESYGWVAPGEKVSGLEDEYNLAPDIPMLIYIKGTQQRDRRLSSLLDRIRNDDRVSYVSFDSATELKRLVTSDLATLLAERFVDGSARNGPLFEPVQSPGATTVIHPPSPLARMIGRDDELAHAAHLLTEEKRRLVTITGPGGVGKTRLAVAVAREIEPSFPGGVAFVDLAALDEPARVIDAIASAVGVRDTGDIPLVNKLERSLRDTQMLLVLDNVEQVVDAAPQLARLMANTDVTLLATSRILLRVDGEQGMPLDVLPREVAIELFVERARSIKPDFELRDSNALQVAAICRALDNLPLAIELAAARIRLLSPGDMAERLHDSLPLLVDGARDRPARQRTLRATIDWSAQLLSQGERALLQRLGVFRSGFALDAVEWMSNDLTSGDALRSLGALVDGSLVQEHDRGSRAWFTMLATVSEYAREQLIDQGQLAFCEERHAEFYLQLTARAGAEIIGPRQDAWVSRLSDEGQEIGTAVEYLLGVRRWDDAVELVWSLDWYWGIAGRLSEVQTWMQQVLDDGADAPARTRAIARFEVLLVDLWRQPDPAAIGSLTQCADFFSVQGDQLSEAKARSVIGLLHVLEQPPDLEAAQEALQRAAEVADSLADPFGRAIVGVTNGRAHLMRGDVPTAIETLNRSISTARSAGDRLLVAGALNARGWAAIFDGDLDGADEHFREELLIASTIGHEPGVGYALEGLFATSAARHEPRRAGQLLGAAEAIRVRKGNSAGATLSFHAPLVEQIERSEEEALFQKGRSEGRAIDTVAAVELALNHTHQSTQG
jgi:predicted ATPase